MNDPTLASPDPQIFGVVPPGVTAWAIRRLREGHPNERLAADRGDGVAVEEWPIAMLTAAFVRENWGPGRYRTYWIEADPDGARRVRGPGKVFVLHASGPREDDAPAESPVLAPAAIDGQGPLSLALQLQQTIDARAERSAMRDREYFARAADREREFLQAVLTATRPVAPPPAPAPLDGALVRLLERMDQRLSRLEAGIGEDGEGAPRGGPFVRPGDSIGEAVTAAAVNGLIENAPQLLSVGASLVNEWRENAKKNAEAQAQMAAMLARSQAMAALHPAPMPMAPAAPPAPAPPPVVRVVVPDTANGAEDRAAS